MFKTIIAASVLLMSTGATAQSSLAIDADSMARRTADNTVEKVCKKIMDNREERLRVIDLMLRRFTPERTLQLLLMCHAWDKGRTQ